MPIYGELRDELPYEVDTEYESMYYTVNLYDGMPIKVQLEVYLDMNYMYWARCCHVCDRRNRLFVIAVADDPS